MFCSHSEGESIRLPNYSLFFTRKYIALVGERARQKYLLSASEASHSLGCSMINHAIYI